MFLDNGCKTIGDLDDVIKQAEHVLSAEIGDNLRKHICLGMIQVSN
jgi:hypothetical protein